MLSPRIVRIFAVLAPLGLVGLALSAPSHADSAPLTPVAAEVAPRAASETVDAGQSDSAATLCDMTRRSLQRCRAWKIAFACGPPLPFPQALRLSEPLSDLGRVRLVITNVTGAGVGK